MSGSLACRCKPREVEVVERNCNYSAFNGYRCTYSNYSRVRCLRCGQIWRTKARYVAQSPDKE